MLTSQKSNWFSTPTSDHLVQYYPYEKTLLSSLEEYIGNGIENNEICLAVLTPRHIEKLDGLLKHRGIDLDSVRQSGLYRPIDANSTLEMLMGHDGLPDVERFAEYVGTMMNELAVTGQPVRVFGEMVALLWKENKMDAVDSLEKLWDNLVREHGFSLYCAYPQLYFDRDIHRDCLDRISLHHTLVTPTF